MIIKPPKLFPWLYPHHWLFMVCLDSWELEYLASLFLLEWRAWLMIDYFRKILFVYVWVCAHCYECSSYKGQRRALDSLKPELHMVVRCWMWVLGTELGPSARSASALIFWDTSPALMTDFHLCSVFVGLRMKSKSINIPGECSTAEMYLQLLLFL